MDEFKTYVNADGTIDIEKLKASQEYRMKEAEEQRKIEEGIKQVNDALNACFEFVRAHNAVTASIKHHHKHHKCHKSGGIQIDNNGSIFPEDTEKVY